MERLVAVGMFNEINVLGRNANGTKLKLDKWNFVGYDGFNIKHGVRLTLVIVTSHVTVFFDNRI